MHTQLMNGIVLTVFGIGLLACGAEAELSSDIWEEIQGEDLGYRSFGQFPGVEATFESSTHNGTVRVYLNDTVVAVLSGTWTDALPDGALLVKEAWSDPVEVDNTPRNITVMKKVEGFAPDSNDWYWVNFAPDGSVNAEGDVASCRDCHAAGVSSDYVLTYDLSGTN